MAKKEIRIITASEDIRDLVDRGAVIVDESKDLLEDDKGIKKKIVSAVEEKFEDGETSVKVEGTKHSAIVTASKSVSIDTESETFPVLKFALDQGVLTGVVEVDRKLTVPLHEIEKAVLILEGEGIEAAETESFSVKAAKIREFNERGLASPEETEAITALEGCLKTATTFRVKYEKRKENAS